MTSSTNEKIYDMDLISKVKRQTGQKGIKKVIKNLKNLAEEDLKQFSKLKIKVFEEEKQKKPEIIIATPIIGIEHYFKTFKKSNPKLLINNNIENVIKNTPSTVNDREEAEQIDSSDFSVDE